MSKTGATGRRCIEIHVDGSSLGNPGPGGFGIVLRDVATGYTRHVAGNRPDATNNAMELLAAIVALKRLAVPTEITLYSDSKYLVMGYTEWLSGWQARGWRNANNKPVANREMWQMLVELAGRHTLTVIWVEGHAGNGGNIQADELAHGAAERLQNTGETSPKLGWSRVVKSE